jgi:hypothetical protein
MAFYAIGTPWLSDREFSMEKTVSKPWRHGKTVSKCFKKVIELQLTIQRSDMV